jgi:hypothetical protein
MSPCFLVERLIQVGMVEHELLADLKCTPVGEFADVMQQGGGGNL